MSVVSLGGLLLLAASLVFQSINVSAQPISSCRPSIFEKFEATITKAGVQYCYEAGADSWHVALEKCSVLGGTLVVIDSSILLDALVKRGLPNPFWIGLTDQLTPGVFRWVNGMVVSWEQWQYGEPKHSVDEKENDHCVSMYDEAWSNRKCVSRLPYMCQSTLEDFYCEPSDRACAPWINIGFSSEHPNTTCGEGAEYFTGVSPVQQDMCRTFCQRAVHFICRSYEQSESCKVRPWSYSNREEAAGCVPEDASSTLYSRIYEEAAEEDMSGLPLHAPAPPSTGATWPDAREACLRLGKQLLTVKSAQKDALLDVNDSWLGLTDEWREGAYYWQDGTFPIFHKWEQGYPSGSKSKNCGFRQSNGKWIDANCSTVSQFLCESVSICAREPCANGGICSLGGDGNTSLSGGKYSCQCAGGFTGTTCTVVVEKPTFVQSSASLRLNLLHTANLNVNASDRISIILDAKLTEYLDGNLDYHYVDKSVKVFGDSAVVDISSSCCTAALTQLDWSRVRDIVQATLQAERRDIEQATLQEERRETSKQKISVVLTWASLHIKWDNINSIATALDSDVIRNVTLDMETKLREYFLQIPGFRFVQVLIFRECVVADLQLSPEPGFEAWESLQADLERVVTKGWMDSITDNLDIALEEAAGQMHSSDATNELGVEGVAEYQTFATSHLVLLSLSAMVVGGVGSVMMVWKYKRFMALRNKNRADR